MSHLPPRGLSPWHPHTSQVGVTAPVHSPLQWGRKWQEVPEGITWVAHMFIFAPAQSQQPCLFPLLGITSPHHDGESCSLLPIPRHKSKGPWKQPFLLGPLGTRSTSPAEPRIAESESTRAPSGSSGVRMRRCAPASAPVFFTFSNDGIRPFGVVSLKATPTFCESSYWCTV